MGDGGSSPSPFIAEEGQPTPPTITCNDGFPCMSQGLVKSGSCRGSVGKRRCSHPLNRHVSTKVARFEGPRRSALDPLASPRSQARARLGPGGYYRRSGNGGPQTCLPVAHGVAVLAGPYGPCSSTRNQDPREGPSLARWTTQDLLRSGLTRLPHKERRYQGGANLARLS